MFQGAKVAQQTVNGLVIVRHVFVAFFFSKRDIMYDYVDFLVVTKECGFPYTIASSHTGA